MKHSGTLVIVLLLALALSGCAMLEPINRIREELAAAAEPTGIPSSDDAAEPLPSLSPEPYPGPTESAPPPALPAPVRSLEPLEDELVCVKDHIPDIQVELRYATDNNFTGQVIYDFTDAWLRYGTVKKLIRVQESLAEKGYGLKIWDAYRPAAAQFVLWEVVPDPRYVGNPYAGYSFHSSGSALDVTLISLDGSPVEMPTDFDDFSSLGDRNYWDASLEAREHALVLENAMKVRGFTPYEGEWWHFTDERSYSFEDLKQIPFPMNREAFYTAAEGDQLSLLDTPSSSAAVLGFVVPSERFQVLGWYMPYARIEAHGIQGYVPAASLAEAEN